jgi:pimeloyl-ACP methyl ester carboxylesterase
VIILTHGWGDSRLGALTRAPFLLPHCSRLVAWDLRGHGDSPGRCTLGTRDVDDLLALIDRVGGSHPIVLFGWSLGAGISIVAAARTSARTPVAAVIAEAPYRLAPTPARNVLRIRRLPYRWNIAPAFALLGLDLGVGAKWLGFDRAEHAARLAYPLLVLHGIWDAICPIEDAREIAARAPSASIVEIPGGGHHTLWSDADTRDRCAAAVGSFLASLANTSSVQPSGTKTE